MSFSGDVKKELCRAAPQRRCCATAEAYGVLLFCNQFSPQGVRIITESDAFAERLPALFKKAFRMEFDHIRPRRGRGKHSFSILEKDKLAVVFAAFGSDPRDSISLHINYAVLEEDCCRTAFLRGAFLGGGSVTDPEKRYHLEMVTSHHAVCREFSALLLDLGQRPKKTIRKRNYVTYFKHSEAIEDFLTALGAPVCAMQVMNAKVEKHLRGSINRRVNCDGANLDKVVDAAQVQISAIRRIERRGGLDALPERLRETALLRLEYPELTLSQLAELCDPPVTKSALNHRLRKLVSISKEEG